MKFKEFLNEEKQEKFAPWHERDPQKIMDMILYNNHGDPNDFKVLKDGSVRVKSQSTYWSPAYSIVKTPEGKKGLPFKFNSCSSFTIRSAFVTDVTGLPSKSGYLTLKLDKIETLKGYTGSADSLSLTCPELEKFECKVKLNHSIFFDQIKIFNAKDFVNSFECTSNQLNLILGSRCSEAFENQPLLSLFKLKSPFLFNFKQLPSLYKSSIELKKALEIINNHSESKNILACQEELMDNGLKAYAKL